MKRKWLIGVGLAVVVGGLVLANLRNLRGAPATSGIEGPEGAPIVKVAKVQRRNITQTVFAPGTLEAASALEIRAPFSTGKVQLKVGLGDKVQKGQVLAELESDLVRLEVSSKESAVAKMEQQLAALNRQRQTQPLELARKVEAAKVQMAEAQQAMLKASQIGEAAKQKLIQAQAALMQIQNRGSTSGEEAEAARQKLEAAEAVYQENPADEKAKADYESAQASYDAALRKAQDEAKQTALELEQAQEAVRLAQAEVDRAQGEETVELQMARSQLENARRGLEIARIEAQSGGGMAAEIRSAQLDLVAAREALNSAREKLSQATITAQADGVILSVAIKDGQPVQADGLILELGGLEMMTIKARADEVDVARIKPGQTMMVKTNAVSEPFTGKVTRVSAKAIMVQQAGPGAVSSSGGVTYEVQGEVTNLEGQLRSGMAGEAQIQTESRENVLVVGLESVREDGGKAIVFVVKDFKVEERIVTIGLRTQTQVEILSGLEEGEQVITGPFNLLKTLKAGTSVRIDTSAGSGESDDGGGDPQGGAR